MKLAEPLLQKLCRLDTMNWIYSFYLTSIYMQSERYEDALKNYSSFLDKLPKSKIPFPSDYIEKIRKRLEYLEKETAKKT